MELKGNVVLLNRLKFIVGNPFNGIERASGGGGREVAG